ncbi:MAG: hypothetical protein RL518_1716 [Pseudomonadota bacterium]
MEGQLASGILCGVLLSLPLFWRRVRGWFLVGTRASEEKLTLGRQAQESLGVLQTFYEHAPSLLGVVELKGADILHVYDNPAACRFFGVLPGQSQGRLNSELHVPLNQTELWLRNLRDSHERKTPIRFEFKAQDSHWLAVTVCPVVDQPIVKQQFCYLGEDISEWKNNAEFASLARQRLQFALKAGRLGFWDWDVVSGTCHYGGDWANLLGFPEDYFQPKISVWESLLHPQDAQGVKDILRSNLDGKIPEFEAEYRLKTGSGDYTWVSARGRVIEQNQAGLALRHVGVIEDIDDRRKVREQLKTIARQKDEFLATLAHELRNPLAPIRTGLAIIQRDPTCDAARQARDMMDRQLSHLVRLIDDLLDVSRVSLGRLELKKSKITLKDVIDTAVEASSPAIKTNGHTLTVDLPTEPIFVNGDLTRLAQVISNLLNNSAKYTPKGGRIELHAQRLPKSAVIKVTDNGLGIPQEMLERIFDMFGQVNRTLDRSQGGLGIGLALVRELVELHNGTVHAESEGQGHGCTFVVVLPRIVEELQPQPADKVPDLGLTVTHKKILVVDDNIDSAESLASFLQMQGHTTRVAHDPAAALALQSEWDPDLMFLDIGLPGMTGYEVARRIRESQHGADVCLIAITGWGTEKDKQNAREAGFNAHLTKPVDLSAVQNLVRGGTGFMEFVS